jgi:hypothetical protein
VTTNTDPPRGVIAIRSALSPFYPTADEQDLWLQSPHPLLGGEAADVLVGTDQEHRVWALIDQLESGAFV